MIDLLISYIVKTIVICLLSGIAAFSIVICIAILDWVLFSFTTNIGV